MVGSLLSDSHLTSAAAAPQSRRGIFLFRASVMTGEAAYLLWVAGPSGRPTPQVVYCPDGEEPTLGRSERAALLAKVRLPDDLIGRPLKEIAARLPLRPITPS